MGKIERWVMISAMAFLQGADEMRLLAYACLTDVAILSTVSDVQLQFCDSKVPSPGNKTSKTRGSTTWLRRISILRGFD